MSVLGCSGSFYAAGQEDAGQNVLPIYKDVVFYDGYRMKDNPDSLLKDGVLRHSCSLYSTQLSDEILDKIGERLRMNVTIGALCDNYDRIGNVNIAFVGKGAEAYDPDTTPRIEIGRFITPFMNKNKEPHEVPYTYDITYLSGLLRDKDMRSKYDLWLEFEVFGIPYAANKQVAGCADRNDVFSGTLEFVTGEAAGESEGNILVPIVIKKPEYIGGNLNNYKEGATDELGKTIKSYIFNVSEDVEDGQLVLITSNHGANSGGEEFYRRWHFVYVDDELVLTYMPGRNSCEPFRQYNTQKNGIYGSYKMSDKEWQSFSNWCPGDVIDNRIINLGSSSVGEHKVTITVPDAKFRDKQGDIPVSMYYQGLKNGKFESGVFEVAEDNSSGVSFSLSDDYLRIGSSTEVRCIEIFTVGGDIKWRQWNGNDVLVADYLPGVYVVCVELADGRLFAKKMKF